MSSTEAASTASASASFLGIRLTFTQGFLAGQLSVVLLALVAIRYIIFEDSRSDPTSRAGRAKTSAAQADTLRKGRKSTSKKDGPGTDGVSIASTMADIMSKVKYEIDSHAGESIDWLNVVVAQALAGYREDISVGGWSGERKRDQVQKTAREWMEEILNARTVGRGMSFLDPIRVTHVDFGDAYPVFTNARVRPADDTGRMRVEVDIDYSDCIAVSIDTKLVLNLPRPRFAVLPISLGLTVERFSGTLAIELFSSDDSSFLPQSSMQAPPRSRHELHFSLHPDFALDAVATSLVGSRAKLQDVPKIEQLLIGRLRSFVHDRFVWPKFWTLTLPNLVPRNQADLPKESLPEVQSSGSAYVAGPGNAVEDNMYGEEDAVAHGEEDGFFDDEPMTSSRASKPYPHHLQQSQSSSSLPGSLPTIEAWRTQSAATGVNPRSRSAARSTLGPSFHSEARFRHNGMSVA